MTKHNATQLPDIFDREFYFDGMSFRRIASLRASFLEKLAEIGPQSSSIEFEGRVKDLFLALANEDDPKQPLEFVATAMGCIRFFERSLLKGVADFSSCLEAEYRRWQELQGGRDEECLPLCRVVPIGVFFAPVEAFEYGKQSAQLTSGQKSAILSAGFMAALISGLLRGGNFFQSYDKAMAIFKKELGCKEIVECLAGAAKLAADPSKTHEAIRSIGPCLQPNQTKGSTPARAITASIYAVMGLENSTRQSDTNQLKDYDKLTALASECSDLRSTLNTDQTRA